MTKLSILKNLGLALGGAALVLTTSSISAADIRTLTVTGDFATAILVLPPLPSFPPGPFQPLLHLLITGDGNLSHLGKVTAATTDEAVDLSVNPNKGTGHWVFQNTRGDALWTEMDLTATPLDSQGGTSFSGILTVIGGSGKFSGATGTLRGEGVAQGSTGAFSITGTVCVTSSEEDK